jgi:putative CocE/NonD family hydrolase
MHRFVSLLLALGLLAVPCSFGPAARAGLLVDVSTHYIEVPSGGDSQSPPIMLAATLYQPRWFPSAPAAVYIHGWGGRRLTGSDNLAYYIASAGYIVLSYTARGFGGGESGGRVSLAGPDEINDLKHVIDWMTNDPDRVIGPRVTKIGVLGGSYGGGHSFQISNDPRVSAVIPLVGWTDLEQSLYPNGAINYKIGLAEFYAGLDRSVGSAPFYNYDRLQFEMFDAAAEGRLPTGEVRSLLAERSIARMDENGRFALKESRQPLAPTFIIQSWDDYLFPATQVLDVYSQIDAPRQIYLGRTGHPPGGHSYDGEELYIGVQALRWFDHYLRGIGGKDSKPVSSAPSPFGLRLLTDRDFPASDAGTLALFLKPNGALSLKRKGKDKPERAGAIFDPQRIRSSLLGSEIPSRDDMFSARVETITGMPQSLVYTLGPIDSEIELMGSSEFTLYVSSVTSSELDAIVRTYDVAPDGTETEVTVGVARVKGLESGEVRRVVFRDFGDHWFFRRGHSIRIKVSNIWFPDFRPPGANDNQVSEITVHYGKKLPSSVRLPVRARQ